MDAVATDLRYAIRALRARLSLVVVATLLLALGVGAGSGVLQIVEGILVDPLAAVAGGRLWALGRNTLSWPEFRDLRSSMNAESVGDAAAYVAVEMGMAVDGGSRLVRGALVSDNYFRILGVRTIAGRAMTAEDAERPVAVISEGLWRSQFGGDGRVMGTAVTLGAGSFEIIGVAEGFEGVDLEYRTDVWVPVAMQPQVQPALAAFRLLERRTLRWLGGIVRLGEDVAPAQAKAWLDEWTARAGERLPQGGGGGWSLRFVPLGQAAISDGPRGLIVDRMRLIAVAAGLILLITCANLSILFLVRFLGRREEIALRLAHGASSGRLARQFALETAIVATLGSAAGLVAGSWLANAGQRLVLPPQIRPAELPLVGWNVAAAFAIGLACGMIALAPVLWRMRRAEQGSIAIRPSTYGAAESARLGSFADRPRAGIFGTFAVAQIALSLILLHSVFLVTRSLVAQARIDPGFTVDGVILAAVSPGVTELQADEVKAFHDRVLAHVRSLSEVRSAALAALAPLGDNRLLWEVATGGDEPVPIAGNVVSAGYFDTLGISLLRGRDFDPQLDAADREPVVIVSEALANRLWPDEEAVGRTLELAGFDGPEPYRVIGVVADSRHGTLQAPPEPFLYRPLTQDHQPNVTLHARVAAPPAAFAPQLRSAIQAVDSRVPVSRVRRLADDVDAALRRPRYLAVGMASLGALAAVLTAIGLYGVLAFVVGSRRREIGIRLSLGAAPGSLRRAVFGRGLSMVVSGYVPGVVLAAALNRLLASRLYGLSSTDFASLTAALLVLTGVALGASGLPAWRATAVDPASLLREP